MKICLVTPFSRAAENPHEFFVEALARHGIGCEFIDSEVRQPLEIGLTLAEHMKRGVIGRLVLWGTDDLALQLQAIAGISRMVIVPTPCDLNRTASWWQQLQTEQFLSFSRQQHEQLLAAGLATAHFHYAPPTIPTARLSDVSAQNSALLWETRGSTPASIRLASWQCRSMGLTHLAVAQVRADADTAVLQQLQGEFRGTIDLPPPGVAADLPVVGQLILRHPCYITPEPARGHCPLAMRALATGRVIIAPDCPPLREHLGHLVTGVLYDPADPANLPWLANGGLHDLMAGSRMRAERAEKRWLADSGRLASLVLGDGRRWSTSDRSAAFGNTIRRNASRAAGQRADSVNANEALNSSVTTRSSRPKRS